MPPSPRYTVRLPAALDALVSARVAAGTPFATLMREALLAYLAPMAPTAPPQGADSAPGMSRHPADTLHTLVDQVSALAERVARLEQALTQHPRPLSAPTPRRKGRAPTPADTPYIPTYKPDLHYLGKLCPQRHDWEGSGQTLRRRSTQACVECGVLWVRAARRKRRKRREQGI